MRSFLYGVSIPFFITSLFLDEHALLYIAGILTVLLARSYAK